MDEKILEIYKHFGKENQIDKALEEVMELWQAMLNLKYAEQRYKNTKRNIWIDKDLRKLFEKEAKEGRGDVIQEMADVTIMLHQMKLAFKISSVELNVAIHDKVERTLKRIKEGFYESGR